MSASSSSKDRIRILVVDDHAVVRAGLRSLLGKQTDMEVIGEAESAAGLLLETAEHLPDVVVADLRMPGEGVLDAIKTLRERWPAIGVVIFSAFDEPADVFDALEAGAAGYVLKQSSEVDLLTAVRRAHQGRRFVDASLAARVLEEGPGDAGSPDSSSLSERETEVLELVARGYTGPQIAAELGVRVGTVETLRHRIRKKLGLKTRADLTRFAKSSRFRRPRR
jgi:DNA-binding NarL/FixJ family response regulator